jgi:HAD superfamily hydrolase (TIGR01509 family)
VLLDVDGTLLDTNYLHALAWWQAMRDAHVTGVSMADTHQAIGIASGELVRRLAGEDNEQAVQAHSERYDAFRDEVTAFAGAAELITACRNAGLAVVLATSGQAEDLDWMLPAIGVQEDDVTGVVTSADVESAKPAPDLLAVAMERFGLDPARTVSVGDTVWDVQASHDAGVTSVAFTTGGIAHCQLAEAGADEIYAGPADLLARWGESRLATLGGSSG